MRPYLEKNPTQKRAGGMAQGVGSEFKPQYCKKERKEGRKKLTKEEKRKPKLTKVRMEINAIEKLK
jgi:hypothetical protein